MKSFTRTACGLALGAFLASAPTALAQGPDATKPYVQSISYGGSGCPQGSVGLSFNNNRLSYTMIFDSMVASSGPAVPVTESKKTCQVTLNISVPAGMSVWTQTASARGYVNLPAGQTGSVQNVTAFSKPNGEAEEEDGAGVLRRTTQTDFVGPVAKDYLVVDGHNYVIHADCDGGATSIRPMALQYTVTAGNAPASSQITLDSLDGALLVQKVKACKSKDK